MVQFECGQCSGVQAEPVEVQQCRSAPGEGLGPAQCTLQHPAPTLQLIWVCSPFALLKYR